MRFFATVDTDIGISKGTNQDSALIRHATTDVGEVLMGIVCDGMGGLSKGELASATVIREFAKWFERELPTELEKVNLEVIGAKWALMLKDLNLKILEYGKKNSVELGTTFSGILLIDDGFIVAHVGDSRVYHIEKQLNQMTTDHTFIAREIRKGTMTPEQAKTDKRRNLLLQCVGASKVVEPEVIVGKIQKGTYMLCSDGFRHEITGEEILEAFRPEKLTDKDIMHQNAKFLIEQVKKRKEKDNISVILIRVS